MSDIALLYATFADQAEAERVAEAVIAERLAACVNVMAPCLSMFRWEGDIARNIETPALFKTTATQVHALRDRIAALHSYDLPVIEAWPVAVADAVHHWVVDETGA